MIFRSKRFHEFYPCFFAVLLSLQLFLVGCVVVPLPWFPTDPYKEPLAALALREAVTREEILKSWGTPWASASEYNLMYVTDKTSSFIVAGGVGGNGGGAPMTQRDYFASFYFDEAGLMKRVDTYADTGNHDHCFISGVCFSKSTRNVPLMSEAKDKEAKQFKASTGKCVVYVFRKPFSDGNSYKEYVDVQLAIKTGGSFSSATSYGASVPGGYFRWELDTGYTYKFIASFSSAAQYPFVTHFAQPKRASSPTEFQCKSDKLIYAALTVPKSRRKAVHWSYPEPESAKELIKDLRQLAGRYLPN
jgi:hypothetical protein